MLLQHEATPTERLPAPRIAYLSMEVGLEPDIPTYAGGLGVLAGDTLRAAADLALSLVGVTLLYRGGYFRQRLDAEGRQSEEPATWSPEGRLEPLATRASVRVEGRSVWLRLWRYRVRGLESEVPVFLLDTDLPENAPEDRRLTDRLYGGDRRHRLCQEAVLGFGALAALRALGHLDVATWHLNEGHSALLPLALLHERARSRGADLPDDADREAVRRQCVFTTHTPVPAGHDQFPLEMVRSVLGPEYATMLHEAGCCLDDTLNMTWLALHLCHHVNGVAMRHWEVARSMFPGYRIDSITNGVHAVTWASPSFQDLFDRHIPGWRLQNLNLRYAVGIPLSEIAAAHAEAKRKLLDVVAARSGVRLAPDAPILGFARRATAYKRADLIFTDPARLKSLVAASGPFQIVMAGKAHPEDDGGRRMIHNVFAAAATLEDVLPVIWLEDYDMELGLVLCAGSDIWLNTPHRPEEASGTSGMKAAVNGVPSLSVLDGWWVEGHVEGVTGWSIEGADGPAEAQSLYDKLEHAILPLYHAGGDGFSRVMRGAIALNASFFNAERMILQYAKNAYDL